MTPPPSLLEVHICYSTLNVVIQSKYATKCLITTWGCHNCFCFVFKWGLKWRLYLKRVSSWLGVALCDGLGVLELRLVLRASESNFFSAHADTFLICCLTVVQHRSVLSGISWCTPTHTLCYRDVPHVPVAYYTHTHCATVNNGMYLMCL